MNSKLVIAGAGAGKSSYLIEQVDQCKSGKILITTFTNANEESLKRKLYDKNGCIPSHITIQTWWSFLLEHCVRPFQGAIYKPRVSQLNLVNGQSGIKYRSGNKVVFYSEEKEFNKHYFDGSGRIYSDKISKFACRCEEVSKGAMIDRLSKCYSYILIDEIQDLSAYDLDLIKYFTEAGITVLMVGDLRQGTYSTSNLSKHKNFKKSKIVNYFTTNKLNVEIDETSLINNYRSIKEIVKFGNSLYPLLPQNKAVNDTVTEHDGVFFVYKSKSQDYVERYKPLQLRYNKRTKVASEVRLMTFGRSKGLEVDRAVIYPTKPMLQWIEDNTQDLADTSRAEFYVAVTRARQSVAFIMDDKSKLWEAISEALEEVEPGIYKYIK